MSGPTYSMIAPKYDCNCCGKPIGMWQTADGGWLPEAKRLAERVPDGKVRTSKGLTCMRCIAKNPGFRPETGEPFDMPRRAE